MSVIATNFTSPPSTRVQSNNPSFQHLTSLLPITSLSFLPSKHISESLLLSGEGSHCKIYSPCTAQLLHTRKIFSREAIRGIAFEQDPVCPRAVGEAEGSVGGGGNGNGNEGGDGDEEYEIQGSNRRILFWGGNRLAVTTLQELIADSPGSSMVDNSRPSFSDNHSLKETPVADYIHCAFFIRRKSATPPLVGIVTSHNLFLLYDPDQQKIVGTQGMGEQCILYSATGLFAPDEDSVDGGGRVIVAAGTIFGEILVWSAPVEPPPHIVLPPPATSMATTPPNVGLHSRSYSVDSESWTEVASGGTSDSEGEGWEEVTKSTVLGSGAGTPRGHRKKRKRGVELHYRLKGHEGSIFGVDISPRLDTGTYSGKKRFLVSCSDDRAVRVWDISKVDQVAEADGDEQPLGDGNWAGKQAESLAWDELAMGELRETGFMPAVKEKEGPKGDCVAIGWGHQARIWNCRFLSQLSHSAISQTNPIVSIVTTSEDLTSKVWAYPPLISPSLSPTRNYVVGNQKDLTELACINTTMLHSGKNVFALAISETHKLLATGGHDGRIAIVSYSTSHTNAGSTPEAEWYEWEITIPSEVELVEAVKRSIALLNITPAIGPMDKSEQFLSKRTVVDQFRNYCVVDANRYIVSTAKGFLALYTFPLTSRPELRITAAAAGWKGLGQWENLGGGAPITAWEGTGLVAAQDRMGSVGIIDIDWLLENENENEGDEEGYNLNGRKGRWWKAGEGNPGGLFCGRHGDLFYLITTSLVTPEVHLHLFPDPRVSASSIRNSPLSPPRLKTIVLCPPANFRSVTSFHLDFAKGLLFLGSRSGILSVFDVWSGADKDVMLNPLDSWRGWHEKDAITGIYAYPDLTSTTPMVAMPSAALGEDPRAASTPTLPVPVAALGGSRTSRILTTGRNGVFAILEVTLNPSPHPQFVTGHSPFHAILTKLHIKRILNNGSIEGAYHRPPLNPTSTSRALGDLLLYGFSGKRFFVYNDTRSYEVFSHDCAGPHRSWIFHPHCEGEGVGWFVWTQAGRQCALKQVKTLRRLLQMGGHGREIKAVAISLLEVGHGTELIATGAEDTLIRISMLQPQRTEKGKVLIGFKTLAISKKHTTGIQCLEWSSCGRWLFSSGGVEEFYVWRVRRMNSNSSHNIARAASSSGKGSTSIGIVHESTCPAQSIIPDLRITSFAVTTVCVPWTPEGQGNALLVTMVYSDSSIKIWLYDPNGKIFRMVIAGRYKTSCLLHVKHFIHRQELTQQSGNSYPTRVVTPSTTKHESAFLLVVAGTDGFVTIWDITTSLRRAGISVTPAGAMGMGSSEPGHSENSAEVPLPPLIARPDLLTSPPPPTQVLSPPHEQWSRQIHQSGVKSLAIMGLDTDASQSPSISSSNWEDRHGWAGDHGQSDPCYPSNSMGSKEVGSISIVIFSGGDDAAFAATVFTLTTVSQTDQSSYDGGLPSMSTAWASHLIPSAQASAVTAVIPVRRGKTRWTGDVNTEPAREVVVGVVTVGVDRLLIGWEVRLLMGAARGGQVKIDVDIVEARGEVRGYSPVADISGAVNMGGMLVPRDIEESEKSPLGGGARVLLVGVGLDVWDVYV